MTDHKGNCAQFSDYNTGALAADVCPVSCGTRTGCALTYDTCWNQQETCQNGGVCVNLPGVEAFRCRCPAGFCTENCATPDTLDHSDGNPNCPVRPSWVMLDCRFPA
eukprot:COSAG04_NODE_8838_length_926_cov_0.800484_1_plen_107_part_00